MIDAHPSLFVLERTAPDAASRVLCLHNVSGQPAPVDITQELLAVAAGGPVVDLISGRTFPASALGTLHLALEPFGVLWLKAA